VVVSAVLVSAALGAGTAFLVAGPGPSEEIASAGPSVSVQSASRDFPIPASTANSDDQIPIAQRRGTESASAGESGPVSTASAPAGPSGADDARLAAGPAFAPEPAGNGEPSHSGHGGTSEPQTGSSPGVPPDDEEPSEEVPEEEEEEEAPAEEPPAEEEKVTICHKAGSTGAKTLTVGASAVEEHLAHGDMLGACP
jgi:hypothetical protein